MKFGKSQNKKTKVRKSSKEVLFLVLAVMSILISITGAVGIMLVFSQGSEENWIWGKERFINPLYGSDLTQGFSFFFIIISSVMIGLFFMRIYEKSKISYVFVIWYYIFTLLALGLSGSPVTIATSGLCIVVVTGFLLDVRNWSGKNYIFKPDIKGKLVEDQSEEIKTEDKNLNK